MMRQLKENSLTQAAAEKLPPEARAAKIVRGVFCDVDKPEYIALYDQVIQRAQQASAEKREDGEVFRAR
jgi:hypothetical protein